MMERNLAACSRVALVLSAVFGAGFAAGVHAQGYPTKPITFLYGQAASGVPAELAYRGVVEEMSKLLGQQVIIDFRPGAGGRLPVQALQRAAADGYTIAGVNNAVLTILPLGSESFKPEPVKDYMPVTLLGAGYLILNGHPSLPFRDAKGLVAYAKANPGKLTFGTAGIGSPSHIAFERFMQGAGIDMLHIPYKGDATADRLSGVVNLFFSSSQVKPLVDAGKLVAFGSASPKRMPSMPSVPTLQEQLGTPHAYGFWNGIIAGAGTPRPILNRLNEAAVAGSKQPRMTELAARAGWEEQPLTTPDETVAFIRTEMEANGQVIRKLGIKFD